MIQRTIAIQYLFTRLTLLMLVPAFAACESPEPHQEATATPSSIRGGALSREFAAAGLILADGKLECTATLVAPDIILTAGHCLASVYSAKLEFVIGADAAHPVEKDLVVEVDMAPMLADVEDEPDLAIARLADPITDVEPAVLYVGDASVLVGVTMRLVGYGSDNVDVTTKMATGSGPRRAASVTAKELFPQLIGYDVMGMGACFGDSGGPAYVEFDGTYEQVGVDSFGDDKCLTVGRYQRLDVYADWLAGLGVPTEERAVSCEEDQICDGQCEADPDCVDLICPLSPDDDSCTPLDTTPAEIPETPAAPAIPATPATPAIPATPATPAIPATPAVPDPCATFMATPGTDGVCYFKADDGTVCDSEPIQTVGYDASTNRCTYATAEGQNCGSAEAYVTVEQQDCVYVDPDGLECGRSAADCTGEDCQC